MWKKGSTAITTSSATDALQRSDLGDVGRQVAVSEHDALGVSGRARAVRQHRQVGGGIEAHVGCGVTVGQACAVEDHHLLFGQTCPRRPFEGLGQQRIDGDQQAGFRIRQLLGDVLGGEQRVDGGGRRTRTQDAVKCDRESRTVRRQQPHHIADADAPGGQRTGKGIDAADQFPVGDFGAGLGVHEGYLTGVLAGELGEQILVDADRRDLDVGEGARETHDSSGARASSCLISLRDATSRNEASTNSATSAQSTSAAVKSRPSQPNGPM